MFFIMEKNYSVLYVELERDCVKLSTNIVLAYIKYVVLQSQLLTTNNRNHKAAQRLTDFQVAQYENDRR